jgi:hypothetical protein
MLYVLYKRNCLRRFALVWAGITVLYLPGMPDFLHNAEALYTGSWVPRMGVLSGIYKQLAFSGITGWGMASIIPIAFFLAGMRALWKRHPKHAVLLLVWFAGPVVIPLVISQFTQPFFITRFAFISLPPLLIITSLGLSSLLKRRVPLVLSVTAIAILFSFRAPAAPFPLEHEDWKRAMQIVSAPTAANPYIVVYPVSTATKMALEYYGGEKLLRRPLAGQCQPDIYVLSRYADFQLQSSCGYTYIKRHMDIAPYVLEYRLTGK